MLVKYTYPVSGDIHLLDHWPITWNDYRVTWNLKGDKVESVTVAVRTTDLSAMPQVTPNPEPGIAASINVGHQPYHDEVESILRTASGLLNFFAKAEIDFARPTIAWEAENDEERAQLKMHSFSRGPDAVIEPHPLSFELVARCFLAAIPASGQEIPLSFLSKGRRDMRADRFIDAFYSYFFYFETKYAPGYSDPKKVKAAFKDSPEIRAAFAEARSMTKLDIKRIRKMAQLMAKSDEDILDHLVDLRGKLHHHALPRKTGSWHPEKHEQFEAETVFISMLAHVVSQTETIPVMYSDEITKQMMEGAQKEGAEYIYVAEADGSGPRGPIPSLRIPVPATGPSHPALETLEVGLRQEGSPFSSAIMRGYKIKSGDGTQIFAEYKNHTFPDTTEPKG